MDIQVKVREVYGNSLVYPVCDKAILFANIAGQKTLTYTTLSKIKSLGYEIIETSDKLKEVIQ